MLFVKLLMNLNTGQKPDGDYLVANRGKLRDYRIHDRGYAALQGDTQQRLLRLLEREKRGLTDQRYWLDPKESYLPVQVEKLKNGRRQQLIQLQKIVWEAPEIKP